MSICTFLTYILLEKCNNKMKILLLPIGCRNIDNFSPFEIYLFCLLGNKRRAGTTYPMVISPGPWIQELTQVTTSDLGITIGCGVTMTQLSLELSNLMGVLPGKYKFSHVLTIEMFNQGL